MIEATGRIKQYYDGPGARSLSVIVLCVLTGRMLVNGIFENNRRKQKAETQSKVYLDTMSYAAHQVRGNVDSILWDLRSSIKMLQQREATSLEQEGVKDAIDEANELLRIFNSILLSARDSTGKSMNLGPKRIGNLSEFVENFCRHRVAQANKSHGWEGTGDPPYPLRFNSELIEPVVFSRDAVQHILAILIDNSVKYSDKSGDIELRLWLDKDWVYLTVRDYGMGITTGNEELIFTPYSRGNIAERSVIPGNGIGLPLPRRLAESQGGTLRAESASENLGSTFLLSLPLETDD